MDRKVAIVGYSLLKNSEKSEITRERMYYKLSTSVMKEISASYATIDTVIFNSNDFMDGRTISEVYLIQRAGAYMRDESKVEEEGLNAVIYAVLRILSGEYDTAMVIGANLASSQYRPLLIQAHVMDPSYERKREIIHFYSGSALQANAYMSEYPDFSERHLAMYAHKGYTNASRNPFSLSKDVPSVEEILNSSPLYLPIREKMVAPYADGGLALVLASEERVKDFTDKPVWIRGIGWSQDTYYIGERDLVRMDGLRSAANMAYKMAGINEPSKELSFAELQTWVASEEPIFAEALGLFEPGSGAKVIEEGLSTIEGKLPVNPSGGPFAGNPSGSTSAIGLVNAVRQLRGEAENNQIKEAKTALVHAQDGLCAQHNAVVILGI